MCYYGGTLRRKVKLIEKKSDELWMLFGTVIDFKDPILSTNLLNQLSRFSLESKFIVSFELFFIITNAHTSQFSKIHIAIACGKISHTIHQNHNFSFSRLNRVMAGAPPIHLLWLSLKQRFFALGKARNHLGGII